ncbi:hypothetical protein H112_06036 [Trichophyton rubrum D6]|uniref:Uncharacterized protein n=3 Tax=Trichophyton TaxID=5550 RepID=A0A080WT26_TRIRC|nr:uncharacterized protein TERG_12043 [Trichophyton rubrum CBS 118892]EZF14870.1 hypothetical protein H100_06050 [Trichophyton rubrum MR850]EZF39851.1 hypothetical protein H102_06019 [Trichophyton rubrum CBS 100081]EZF50534.1 hypothetical protein H103_06043 [Trichophyton rubrum CBS 288.86]EZF61171.1 hypothetical protein H104_06032 [Trichophyton rubrum CBS 289.86]EZF71802.1 hypothetical protein H105_06057 [Trichophyton soudanense CBS 452.61]EZF82384.1 hypothetical protein H110_06040 [Trichophy
MDVGGRQGSRQRSSHPTVNIPCLPGKGDSPGPSHCSGCGLVLVVKSYCWRARASLPTARENGAVPARWLNHNHARSCSSAKDSPYPPCRKRNKIQRLARLAL